MNNIVKTILIGATLSLVSCASTKDVPYIVDAETIPAEVLATVAAVPDATIMPGDLLNIDISAVNMSAVAPFNKGTYVNLEGQIVEKNHSTIGAEAEASTQYYLVDKNGDIDFPIVGRLHVGGMNKAAIESLIQGELYPKYLKEIPSVDIRLMNFKVTVLGAVKSPGIVEATNERLNLFEALALAGDTDIKGRRDNVKLIRTKNDGTKEIILLNLNDKNLLLSPYFNLQQNDIIYVSPNSSLAQSSWQMNPAVSATITVVAGLSSVASLVIGIINLNK